MTAVDDARAAGTAPATVPVPQQRTAAPSRWPAWSVLVIACVAQFMGVLDVSIVNVALPSIARSLHLTTTGLQWVVNAYALPFAGFLLLGGRAGDVFGRKRVFLLGLWVFVTASLLGGLATSGAWLTSARALQGLGGAILAPSTLTLLTTTYTEPRARARALGVWSATAGSAGAFGALAGGVLTDLASWRWVLLVNVPIGAALLAAAAVVLVESPVTGRGVRRLDLPGTVLATAGLTLLAYGIVGTQDHPWGSARTVGVLLAAAALLACFLLRQRHAEAPLVPLRVFRAPGLALANAVAVLVGVAMFATFFFVSLYEQGILGYRPLTAGLALLPMAGSIVVAAMTCSRQVPRIGPRPLVLAGTATAAAGLAWLSRAPADGTFAVDLLGPSVLLGLGIGAAMVPLTVAAVAALGPGEQGLASALLNTARQVGGAAGLAACTTVAVDHTRALLRDAGAHPAAAVVHGATAAGYGRALLVAAGCLVVGAALATRLPGGPPPGPPGRPHS